jgi:hypothetical protein
MTRRSIRAAPTVLLVMLMLPLAACPSNGSQTKDGDHRSPTQPS